MWCCSQYPKTKFTSWRRGQKIGRSCQMFLWRKRFQSSLHFCPLTPKMEGLRLSSLEPQIPKCHIKQDPSNLAKNRNIHLQMMTSRFLQKPLYLIPNGHSLGNVPINSNVSMLCFYYILSLLYIIGIHLGIIIFYITMPIIRVTEREVKWFSYHITPSLHFCE